MASSGNVPGRILALGTAAAAVSGACYAATTVIGRSLARDGVGATTVLSVRFGIGGLLLVLLVVASGRSLWPARGERLAAALLGTVGYAFEASLFFAGLERGSAAAISVIFYAYPLLVALIEIALGWIRLSPRLAAALLGGAIGTLVVIVTGADVSVSTAGVFFALGAAGSFALYLLATDRLLVRTDSIVRAAWVSAGAGVGMLLRGLATGGFDPIAGYWPRLIAIGLANAAAFGFLFAALPRIGATRTAVVLNVEPIAAVTLGAIFLAERLALWQLVGGALVVIAAVVVALPERAREEDGVLPIHPPPGRAGGLPGRHAVAGPRIRRWAGVDRRTVRRVAHRHTPPARPCRVDRGA